MGIVGLKEFKTALDRLGLEVQTTYKSVKNYEVLYEDINQWWDHFYKQLQNSNQQPTHEDVLEIYKKFNSTVDIGAQILTFIKTKIVNSYNDTAQKFQDFCLQNNFDSWEGQLRSLVENTNNLKKVLYNLVEGVKFNEYFTQSPN